MSGGLVAGSDMVIDGRVIAVTDDPLNYAARGAHVVVAQSVRERAFVDLRAGRPTGARVDRLLATSVLVGPLDDALDAASHEVATAFGVARCIISDRAEPLGEVPVEGATWDVAAWNSTTRYCRAAAACDATLVVPAPQDPGECDSYVAVALDSPRGSSGFVGLQATGARAFTDDERAALRAIAARFGRELHARTMLTSTAEELERSASGPGLDPQLAIWNRNALAQLAHAQLSGARRFKLPLAMLVVRVVDLAGVNTRLGVAIGDRLLRRIAEGLRPALRAEDLLGRYSGTMFAVLLFGTGAEDAKRVAERIHAMLAARSLELEGGETLALRTTIGVTAVKEEEDAAQLLARTTRATKQSPDNVVSVVSGPTTLTGRVPHVTDASALELRATLGGTYRLRHEINRGGMGVVYRADDLALERPVAIKMLRPDLAEDKNLVLNLRREAALLARLHHPNLVQIYNFGQTEGECYFVMELVEGESLQQAIDRHRAAGSTMPIPELLAVVDQIASALDALHERGVVHRDVKPANFIRDPFTNRSVLVDVGIAHAYGERAKRAGTPGYIAPEVIQGEPASERADVYGLAAAVIAIATTLPPWGDGDALAVLERQIHEEPMRVSTTRPDLAPIDQILADALSVELERRPKSAGALSRALAAALGTILPTVGRTTARRSTTSSFAVPRTRGVVFRSVARALGVRDADRLRDLLGREHEALVTTMTQSAPLAWLPSEQLVELLAIAPSLIGRDPVRFARDLARATVRTSFRSFFPASAATLHADRTLSAIKSIWSRYHTWGEITAMPVRSNEMVIKLTQSLQQRAMCEWTCELIDTLVVLSGGSGPMTVHDLCEAEGDEACRFRVSWQDMG